MNEQSATSSKGTSQPVELKKRSHNRFLGEVITEKRVRRAKETFTPDIAPLYKRRGRAVAMEREREEEKKSKRTGGRGKGSLKVEEKEEIRDGQPVSRNMAKNNKEINKWDNYRVLIKRALSYLLKEWHYLELTTGDKELSYKEITTKYASYANLALDQPSKSQQLGIQSSSSKQFAMNKEAIEIGKIVNKINSLKYTIFSTLETIATKEHQEHRRWPQLAPNYVSDKKKAKKDADSDAEIESQEQEVVDDGMFDVEDILCSVCNGEEEEGNDILFCDHAQCYRAYHQRCLSPILDMDNMDCNPDHDWFCWQCECLDDCLDLIGERVGKDWDDWRDVFTEIRGIRIAGVDTMSGVKVEGDSKDGKKTQTDTIMGAVFDEEEDEEEDGDFAPSEDDDEEEDEDEEGDNEDGEGSDEDEEMEVGDDDEEDEDDDEDDADEDDDDVDPDADEDGLVDDLDEDELNGLLQDANADYQAIASTTVGGSTRKLRDRSQMKSSIDDDSSTELTGGSSDLGKEVARVVRGSYEVGKVVEFVLEGKDRDGMLIFILISPFLSLSLFSVSQ